MSRLASVFFAACVAAAALAKKGGGDHKAFDYGAAFNLQADTYTWTFHKDQGEHADGVVNLVILPSTGSGKRDIKASAQLAEQLFEGTAFVDVHDGESVAPNATTVWRIQQDVSAIVTSVNMEITAPSKVVVFGDELLQHRAEKVEGLWSSLGAAVYPASEIVYAMGDDHHEEEDDEGAVSGSALWGWTMLACFIACMLSLAGVLVTAVPLVTGKAVTIPLGLFNAAASGALISAAAFLIIPEATELLGESEEWMFGTLLLVGFFTGVMVDYVSQIARRPIDENEVEKDLDGPRHRNSVMGDHREASVVARFELAIPKTDEPTQTNFEAICCTELMTGERIPFDDFSRHQSVVWSLLVGDFCHNLVDGMVMGVAFKACNPTFALSVAAGVATHEISSEIADFGVFVTDGRLTVSQALVLNFICSLSTILGGIIVLANEEDISDEAQGLLLAFSAGVYIFVGAAECWRHWAELTEPDSTGQEKATNRKEMLKRAAAYILTFFVFSIAIGLVLLDHEHCGGHDHDHEHEH